MAAPAGKLTESTYGREGSQYLLYEASIDMVQAAFD